MARKYSATVLIGRMGCDVGGIDRETDEVNKLKMPSGAKIPWSNELHAVIEAYEARCHEERTRVDPRITLRSLEGLDEDAAE